jgi:ParE toxin of type II toxin-antitoxin system, parDE
MKVSFLKPADDELHEAIAYYQIQRDGLGDEFLIEVLSALDRIKLFPQAWSPLSKRTRRCLIRRFPYGIVYSLREDEILVVAVAHLHRQPLYWENRLNN